MKDQGDLDKRPRLPGKINDHRPRQKADSWKKERERNEIGYGRVIEWFPGWRVTSSVAVFNSISISISLARGYFVSLTSWAKPQTCKPHSLEPRKTTIDSYLNYMYRYFQVDSSCTHVDLRLYLYTLVIFQRKPRSQESSLVFDTIDIPLTPFCSSEIVVRSLREVWQEVKRRGGLSSWLLRTLYNNLH